MAHKCEYCDAEYASAEKRDEHELTHTAISVVGDTNKPAPDRRTRVMRSGAPTRRSTSIKG